MRETERIMKLAVRRAVRAWERADAAPEPIPRLEAAAAIAEAKAFDAEAADADAAGCPDIASMHRELAAVWRARAADPEACAAEARRRRAALASGRGYSGWGG